MRGEEEEGAADEGEDVEGGVRPACLLAPMTGILANPFVA